MSKPDREYELFVRDITEALLKADGLQTVKVQHDVQVQGISRSHQIDVYWEYRLGGVLHRVIINCKNYTATIEVTHILTLAGVLQDLPGVRGLIVTTVGFQKGAIDYAKVHQIGLKVIRSPKDEDWEGRFREIHLELAFHKPELLETSVFLNPAGAALQPTESAPVAGPNTFRADRTVVKDLDSAATEDMNDLWNRAMKENPTETGCENTGTVSWTNAFLQSEGMPDRRIDAIRFRWRINEGSPLTTVLKSDPKAIVRDAINGNLLFVDPDGAVSGDVDDKNAG